MSRVSARIDIAAPPAQVWEVVMDPRRLGDWVTIHRRVAEVSDSPLRDGSTLEQVLHLRGMSIKVRWTVAEARAPHRAVWEGRGPARARARICYELSPEGADGTRFEYVNDFKAPLGPIGAAASRALVGGVSQREADRSLHNLKELIEGE
jgi:carbon monoxide dehydrogenase subunit G